MCKAPIPMVNVGKTPPPHPKKKFREAPLPRPPAALPTAHSPFHSVTQGDHKTDQILLDSNLSSPILTDAMDQMTCNWPNDLTCLVCLPSTGPSDHSYQGPSTVILCIIFYKSNVINCHPLHNLMSNAINILYLIAAYSPNFGEPCPLLTH